MLKMTTFIIFICLFVIGHSQSQTLINPNETNIIFDNQYLDGLITKIKKSNWKSFKIEKNQSGQLVITPEFVKDPIDQSTSQSPLTYDSAHVITDDDKTSDQYSWIISGLYYLSNESMEDVRFPPVIYKDVQFELQPKNENTIQVIQVTFHGISTNEPLFNQFSIGSEDNLCKRFNLTFVSQDNEISNSEYETIAYDKNINMTKTVDHSKERIYIKVIKDLTCRFN